MEAIINNDINWNLVTNADEVKDTIIDVMDKFVENVIYSVISENDTEALKSLNWTIDKDGFVDGDYDTRYMVSYECVVNFLTKYYPYANWNLMVDLHPMNVWNNMFNIMNDIYDSLSVYIITKAQRENNLKLDLVF